MVELSKKEIVEIFEDFLNNNGLWNDFKDFVEEKGYQVTELGFSEDDI